MDRDELIRSITEILTAFEEDELAVLPVFETARALREARRILRNEKPCQWPEWIDVRDRLPEDQAAVLAVKELKSGRREITIARFMAEYEIYDATTGGTARIPYWVCGGNNHIIRWLPLPPVPEEG
ncbi:MAG: DUF551 domain-containing protein [Clostridia bacterium]|nr:DUF551 domain-containing protein [Clostridia bacterium]